MPVRFEAVPFDFNGTSEVIVRTMPADASDSVLVGLSFLNTNVGINDRTVLVRQKLAGVYSGAYREFVPTGEANKAFTPGCLAMKTAGEEIAVELDGAGAFKGMAVFRETYT